MTLDELSNLASSGESIATIVALVMGGYWTYRKFIKQRHNFAPVDFTVDFCFLGKQDGFWIVELIANMQNKGGVTQRFTRMSFDLTALFSGDSVVEGEQYNGEVLFPHALISKSWPPKGEWFIEPGAGERYSYVARVPETASFLMLHGRFLHVHGRPNFWQRAKRTVRVPTNQALDLSHNESVGLAIVNDEMGASEAVGAR